jgi:hypothetical protein
MAERSAVRVVPRNPITVALQEAGSPFAYGVVANISDGGACIWTNAELRAGRRVSLRLSFMRGSQPLDEEGVVVWGAPQAAGGGVRYGLQWSDQTPDGKRRLSRMISASG